MLHQEINLYRTLAPAKVPQLLLNWRRFCLSQVFLLAMMILLYLGSLWDIYLLTFHKARKQAQLTALQTKFDQIKKTYPQLFFSQDVHQILNKLQQDLIMKQKILESIRNQSPFSQNLLALSRTIAPNVWLTDIIFTAGGKNIDLKGKSMSMENLQTFLDNLAHEKTFSGFTMSTNNIENTSKNNVNNNVNSILTFEIEMDKNE